MRGLAAVALGERTPYDDAERIRIARVVAPLSGDAHWFVRLCSLDARAEVKDPSVLPALIALLDDQSDTKFVAEGWVQLDGSRKSERLNGVLGDTLSESAIWLLRRMTKGKPYAFDPTPIDFDNEAASRKRVVDEAKIWAEQNAALLKG